MNVVAIIREAAAKCVDEADSEGFDGATYELTGPDCDYVVDAVKKAAGSMPFRQEWHDAGFGFVGGKHYDDDSREGA